MEILVSKKLLQSQKPEVPYFTSVLGNPPLYCPLPPETAIAAESTCAHYDSVMGQPETEGNSLRMQWLCCFVDIMLEFTWGNVRENHNIILLLRRGGQETETGSDLIWGFYKPYCGTEKNEKNSLTEHYSTILTHATKYHSDDVLLGKDKKMLHQWAKTCFIKIVEVYSMFWYAEQRNYLKLT